DAFGNILSDSNASFSDRYKWTGREFDSETSFQYNRARYYDPKMGRWSSLDPLGFDSEDGNLYRYVHNSSPNAIDPWGLVDLPILDNVNNYKPPEGGASIGQMMVDIIPGLNPDLKSAEPQIKFLLQLNEIN